MEMEKKLKDTREKAGFTQEQIAERIMVSRQTVSNWENGKSLPDIISIIKLSELYQVSVDEWLKDDQNLKRKIEKDASIAKTNTKVILVTAAVTLAALGVYLISVFVGGAFLDFCENAIKWVMAGIGVAFVITCAVNRNSHHVLECIKGVFKMKRLQILAVVLLLLGIWLSIAPIGQSSDLPEVASIASAALGVLCGVASLFAAEQ